MKTFAITTTPHTSMQARKTNQLQKKQQKQKQNKITWVWDRALINLRTTLQNLPSNPAKPNTTLIYKPKTSSHHHTITPNKHT
jgi:hypothetical protein